MFDYLLQIQLSFVNRAADNAAGDAEAVRHAIRTTTFVPRPYGFNNPALNLQAMITASLGVASIRSNATPAASIEQQKNELLHAADMALYKAKGEGRGTYRVFKPEMDVTRAA